MCGAAVVEHEPGSLDEGNRARLIFTKAIGHCERPIRAIFIPNRHRWLSLGCSGLGGLAARIPFAAGVAVDEKKQFAAGSRLGTRLSQAISSWCGESGPLGHAR